MFCLSRRTVLFCCVLVVSMANVAKSDSPTFDPISLLPTTRTCGIQNSDRIISGERTRIDEHPWVALLPLYSPGTSGSISGSCGGVLISERYVLTAAHCVPPNHFIPPGIKMTYVILGEWDITSTVDCDRGDCSPPPQYILIEKAIVHEGYLGYAEDDIALLRLVSKVQFTDFVKPICLPLSDELRQSSFIGENLEVAGWGETENGNTPNVKLKTRVPVIPPSQCANLLQNVNITLSNKQVCAGGIAGGSTCRGDSGGPLMGYSPQGNNWVLVGIVSHGSPNCTSRASPGIYTRVGAYIPWILSKLRP